MKMEREDPAAAAALAAAAACLLPLRGGGGSGMQPRRLAAAADEAKGTFEVQAPAKRDAGVAFETGQFRSFREAERFVATEQRMQEQREQLEQRLEEQQVQLARRQSTLPTHQPRSRPPGLQLQEQPLRQAQPLLDQGLRRSQA